jgi:hypothetical protein
MLRAVQPVGGKWKILLVDGKGLRILNSTCKTMEILEENVTGIAGLLYVHIYKGSLLSGINE